VGRASDGPYGIDVHKLHIQSILTEDGEVLGIQDDDVAELGLWGRRRYNTVHGDSRRVFNISKDIEVSGQETLSSAISYGAGGRLRRARLCLWSEGLPMAETE
jgi:hypothetical protein